jgi:hypothetical protein
MARGPSRIDFLRAQLKRVNPDITIECQSLERKRCTVHVKAGAGVSNLSHNLVITELEEWVDGFVKGKENADLRYKNMR